MDFFRTRTVPQLSGFFISDFWDRWVLQLTHHEPAIRHAVIALGAQHARFVAAESLTHEKIEGDFALQQYGWAIKELVKPAASSELRDVCLISCVLFACFEVRVLRV